jgi:NCAIR mutase (PurE)-related protein
VDVERLKEMLAAVARGEIGVEEALRRLAALPFETVEFATLDHHRALRCGHPEVIFCQGKTVEQVVGIARRLADGGACVLATRTSAEQREGMVREFSGAEVNEVGRTVVVNPKSEVRAVGRLADNPNQTSNQKSEVGGHVAVVCAGTSDFPVAEEACVTLRAMGARCFRLNDVGVAGLHRLLPHVSTLQRSCAVVAIAGMEGALPSVIGGLVACPVFAVPTSVGYGASLGGLTAMLAMLNSCASNVSVVNIDNGFGAAYSAGLVYRQVCAGRKESGSSLDAPSPAWDERST